MNKETQQEIFERLMSLKSRQLFDDEDDEQYYGTIMWDVARAIGLTDQMAAELAGDMEIPDDLITVTEAAKLAGVTTQAVSGRIARNSLIGYRDPDEPNPTRATRVSRAEVEAQNWRPHPTLENMEGFLSQDTSTIQHALAEQYRANTGSIPRGQLWQPCERRGCDNEPVCMNCMQCEEKHCHCFD